MQKSLSFQLIALAVLSIIVGVANNFRPSARIEWVRDWPPYSSLQSSEQAKKPATAEPQTAAEDSQPVDESEVQAMTSDLVVSNQGITDIELEQAVNIYRYASDFTFWIDARDPALYEEGHIAGAQLLYLYEKNSYLGDIQAQIEERQPAALVVYCKGKDCTDSHHLAQDLAALGYQNIFVYKGGFEEWFKAGHPIEGTLAEQSDETTTPVAEADTGEQQAEVAEWVVSNQGITDIDLQQAHDIFKYTPELTLWIDAREPALFEAGHIKGSELLYLYEKNDYMPQVEALIAERQPAALVVYCKGKECTDSHHLAQDLAGRGFENIFVYKDGFDDWFKAGYPIEGTMAEQTVETSGEGATASHPTPRQLEAEKPPGMYLEHVVRDMLPFLFGMLLLLGWKHTANNRAWVWTASIVVGGFFIWAALPKLGTPLLFAKNIWNYDIVPGQLVNISALLMPAAELLCGIGLITGLWRKGSGFYVSLLLLIFIAAVSFNVFRGHEFNCGCTSTATMFTDAWLTGWNDKITLILRDIGLLVMSVMAFRGYRVNQMST